MASRDINDALPALGLAYQSALMEWRIKYPTDPEPFITCSYRSPQEQDALYAQGRTAPGKVVTNARAGQSLHNSFPSKAIDIAFKNHQGLISWDAELFHRFAEIVKKSNPHIHWGGDWTGFKDLPHFELP